MIGEKREEVLKNMPIIENHVTRSKDGKYVLHKTVITHIKPAAYYEAVLKGNAPESEEGQSYLVEEGKEIAA